MPELPEVESVRRGLERARLVAPITSLWRSEHALRTGALWRDERLAGLVGAHVQAIERRGKFIVVHLRAPGDRELGLLVHLGMTGSLRVVDRDDALALHTHVRIAFADGRELRFVDPRRFGGMILRARSAIDDVPPLRELGPEPLARSFHGDVLQARAGHSIRTLHEVLLDQRVLAGVGNIYAQEALFVARLHPLIAATRLRASAWQRLAKAVQSVLRQGLRNGGTTFRDYRDADGNAGRNQRALAVYGRAGQPCRTCGTILRGYVRAGRSGAYCPNDQARPTRRRVD